jgi:hypothetical protein
MKFTVTWRPTAKNELAKIWMNAKNRNQVRLAADKIDSLLKWNPEALGESRREPVRILVVPPLAVEYQVQEDDRIVSVVAVWTFKRRK